MARISEPNEGPCGLVAAAVLIAVAGIFALACLL